MADATALLLAEGHEARFDQGRQAFAALIRQWMDGSGWSHPKMIDLGRACMHGTGWLHSSQLSGLRTGQLRNPGPRVFVALERLNFYLHRYSSSRQLLPGTSSSAHYAQALAISVNGQAPELGWWAEAFCGQRLPLQVSWQPCGPVAEADAAGRAR